MVRSLRRPSGAHVRRSTRSPGRSSVFLALVVIAVAAFTNLPGRADAATFNANYLISDAVFDATGSMTTAQIQALFDQYPNSCLSSYQAPLPIDYSTYGSNVSAATVIQAAAALYAVNPQVLVVTLEKEQSLVTGGAGCAPWRYWSAMGYSCPDGGAMYSYPSLGITGTCVSSQQNAGFSAQVNHAAWQLQFNRQRAVGNLNWRGNQNVPNYGFYTQGYRQQYAGAPSIYYDGTATIDNQIVTMTNGPTATLYTYTPHLSANQAFVTLFTNWFGSPTGSTSVPPATSAPTTVAATAPPTTVPVTTVAPNVPPAAAAAYAGALYELFLGRSATASETAAWVAYLQSGGTRANMASLVLAVPGHATATVNADYVRMLGRQADSGGLAAWSALLLQTGRNEDVLAALASSTEYFQRCSSSNSLFVQCTYNDLLGRAADPAGLAFWSTALASGTTRSTVVGAIIGTDEYVQNVVNRSYRTILGRGADPGGLAAWSAVYRQSRNEDQISTALASSPEGWQHLSGS